MDPETIKRKLQKDLGRLRRAAKGTTLPAQRAVRHVARLVLANSPGYFAEPVRLAGSAKDGYEVGIQNPLTGGILYVAAATSESAAADAVIRKITTEEI